MRTILTLCGLASFAGAQQFSPQPEAPAWHPLALFAGPQRLAFADVDNDGDCDAAVTSGAGTAASGTYLARNGGNQAAWTPELVMPIAADAMAWADMDGDGDPDLLLGGRSSWQPVGFGVLRNDGPTFTWLGQRIAPFGPGSIRAFATGDFDGDLDVDVVVGGEALPGSMLPPLCLFRNDGAGGLSYDPSALPSVAGTAYAPIAVDFDGDADLDVLAGEWANAQSLLQLTNSGAGTFTNTSATLPAGSAAARLAGSDVDGDGFVDLVTCAGAIAVLWGTPGGSFLPPQTLAAGLSSAQEPVIADVDGDGARDIVVRTGVGMEQRRNLGSRSFGLDVLIDVRPLVGSPVGAVGIGVGDTVARGRQDTICTLSDGTHRLALGSPDGLLLEPAPPVLPVAGPGAVADLDGNGFDDVLVLSGGSPQVFRHLGRGRWTTSARLASLPNNWLGVRLADLDGDGQLDAVGLATAGGLPGVNVYMRRPPALEFQWLQPGIAISLASDMELGDVDGDGDVDAVVASAQGTLLLANPGDGALSAPIPVPGVPPSATSICELSDLDGDGDDDLVLGPLSACVQVLWNDGAGTFTAGPCLPLPGTGVRAATVADLDADGRLDVAFVARPDLVMWYRQLPGGTFAAGPSPAPVGFDPEQLLAADIDDDGDADLLLAGDPALALRNDGNGVFTGDPSALPTGRTGNLVAIDLDEDGDADLVGSRSGSVAAVVLENRARSARSGHVPRVGGSLAVEFLVAAGAASPGALLIPGGTFDIVPGIEVPSVLGTLLLGPAPLQLPWVPIAVPAGSGTLLTAVPPAPELAGVHVSVQGLAFSQAFGLGFTNVVDERIRP